MLSLLIANTNLLAAGSAIKPPKQDWSFTGITGKFDRASIQRGFQIYKEVCAACHSLNRVYYRNLEEVGFSAGEVKTIARQYQVTDGPDDYGEMYKKPAEPFNAFVAPFPNEQAARAANGGAYPVDLSLIIKARPNGADYLYALLLGYEEAPAGMKLQPGMSYNKYFPGNQIAMPKPLFDNQVEYIDGTAATTEQMSRDVVNFLQWASEPEMEKRNKMGIKVIIFLIILSTLFYFTKRSIWSKVG